MKKIVIGFAILFCLCSFARAQNVLLNSSYEIWLDSLGIRLPFGWYTSEPQDSGTATRVTDPHSGIYAMQLNGSDTSAYAATLSICFPAHNYYFSGWCKSNSFIAGSFIINWFSLSQQIVGNPVLVPIYRSTNWQRYTQMLTCPDSAALVNVNIVTLPYISITVDDVTLTDTILVGIEEQPHNTAKKPIKIFPNPCHGELQIAAGEPPINIMLYDIAGNLININIDRNYRKTKINTSQLSEGIYFIKVVTQDRIEIQKVIVRN